MFNISIISDSEEVEAPRPYVQLQEYNGFLCPHQEPIMMSMARSSEYSYSHIVYNNIQVRLISNRLYIVEHGPGTFVSFVGNLASVLSSSICYSMFIRSK